MKRWKIVNKLTINKEQFTKENIIKILLENRGIKTKKEIDEFLNPQLEDVTVDTVGIDKSQLKKAIARIKQAVEKNEKIVIFGDYDVDGICGTAILWETIYSFYKNVIPYIPHRADEGYGLSVKGIENLLSAKVTPLSRSHLNKTGLIITVDNGIVASSAVEFANKNGIDVIITDHHVVGKKLPPAYAVVHTTKLCGAGVAYLLAQEISNIKYQISDSKNAQDKSTYSSSEAKAESRSHDNTSSRQARTINLEDDHLELVALATIADLVPLVGANRTLVKYGLEKLQKTKRVGLKALFSEAKIDPAKIGVYEVGHMIAPRLNAMGRLLSAMDSLRLVCAKNNQKALDFAAKLGSTNRDRQLMTEETVLQARSFVAGNGSASRIIFVAHKDYNQGVIGLVASKLVEEFYKPSFVLSIGETHSKGSARSIHGFDIIEFIRSSSDLLVDAGGHPMAAGFTVETEKIELLKQALEQKAQELLDDEMMKRTLTIDLEIDFQQISPDFYKNLQALAPYGMGNMEPTFATKQVTIDQMKLVGNDGKHLKLTVSDKASNIKFEAIAFGMGQLAQEIHTGDSIDIAYTIDEDTWLARRSFNEGGNGTKKLQLKIRDIKKQLLDAISSHKNYFC